MRHMDYDKFKEEYEIYKGSKKLIDLPNSYKKPKDMVNSPAHYTRGSQEVIDIIEQAIADAPSTVEGYLHGQALKYLLRVWLKDSPKQDCEKCVWYLNRLINKLN